MAGFVISLMAGEFANGIRLIERSLALNPNSAISGVVRVSILALLRHAEPQERGR
jgi:hypothetical protein